MIRQSFATLCLVAASAVFAAACSSADPSPAEPLEPLESSESAITAATPKPFESLPLENGNVVEFYEFSRGVLVSERGAAYTNPVLDGKGKDARDLVATWTSLAPKVRVPASLHDVQARLSNLPAPAPKAPRSRVRRTGGALASTKSNAKGVTPSGLFNLCNNGCCDANWMLSQTYCAPGSGMDQTWFLFDYGYDYAIFDDIVTYRAIVCAAVGTSTYTVTIDGSEGGTWSVPQATYRTYFWFAGHSPFCLGLCGEDMLSNVNNYQTNHMHSYCGGVNLDDD